MLLYLKALILPDTKTAIVFTAILTIAICVGTLTPLSDKIYTEMISLLTREIGNHPLSRTDSNIFQEFLERKRENTI